MNMCYCNTCKSEFEKKYGAVPSWPKSVMLDGDCQSISDLQKKYVQFRCDNITALVREVSKRVRKEYPNVSISAAVLKRGGETDKASMAQDWGLWCREGYLDFVCPMNYLDSKVRQRAAVQKQLKMVAGLPVKVYPGVGLSVFKKDRCDARRLSEQIAEIRACGAPGFTVFNFDKRALDALPRIPRR
jgi:uncharacterized lipoprotein YddW (UPF0748 family)